MGAEVLNLLVLPLLGGYIFYTRFHQTSFAAKRAEGQRLFYSSGVVGVILLIAAHGSSELLLAAHRNSAIFATILSLSLICTAASAFVTGLLLLMFCGKNDLKEIEGALPFPAHTSGFILAAFAVMLCIFNYRSQSSAFLPGVFATSLALFAGVVLATKWVINTSRLHYSTVVARVALTILSLFAGLFFALIYGPWLAKHWSSFSTIQYSGTALLAMALGAFAWMPANVFISKRWAWRRTHLRGETSGLENLLFQAFLELALFQITLKDGKVYVGFLLDMPAPQARLVGSCIEFVPVKSGYRKHTTKAVVTTTNYANVLAKIGKESGKETGGTTALMDPGVASMTKVVPIAEIVVAGRFNENFSDRDFSVPRRPRKKPVRNNSATTNASIQAPPSTNSGELPAG